MYDHSADVAAVRAVAEEVASVVLPWALGKRSMQADHWRLAQSEVSTVETERVADLVAAVAVGAVAIAVVAAAAAVVVVVDETARLHSTRLMAFRH